MYHITKFEAHELSPMLSCGTYIISISFSSCLLITELKNRERQRTDITRKFCAALARLPDVLLRLVALGIMLASGPQVTCLIFPFLFIGNYVLALLTAKDSRAIIYSAFFGLAAPTMFIEDISSNEDRKNNLKSCRNFYGLNKILTSTVLLIFLATFLSFAMAPKIEDKAIGLPDFKIDFPEAIISRPNTNDCSQFCLKENQENEFCLRPLHTSFTFSSILCPILLAFIIYEIVDGVLVLRNKGCLSNWLIFNYRSPSKEDTEERVRAESEPLNSEIEANDYQIEMETIQTDETVATKEVGNRLHETDF